MKAIKLASIFAVSAVAAAVSTTTFAVEPVFSGTAGLNYSFGDENAVDSDGNSLSAEDFGSEGEVNIIGDTGLVYFDLDMSDGSFVLDEAYVTVGAVQFGDFDGSLMEDAIAYASVEEEADTFKDLDATLAVRYAVTDEFTVALEAEEDTKDIILAAAYSADLGAVELNVSAGFEDTEETTALLALGVFAAAGDMVTLGAYVQAGEIDGAETTNFGIGADVAFTESVVLSMGYTDDAEDDGDSSTLETTINYTAGDIRYYVTYLAEEADDANWGYAGVEASF